MKRRKLQIDMVGFLDDVGMVKCKIYIDGRGCQFFTSKANYEALMYDKVFIRDGKTKDSAGVINTTNVFEELV